MAIQQNDGTSYTTRVNYGDFPDCTGNWTIFIQFKYTNIPVGFAQILDIFLNGDNDNIYLGSANNTSDVFAEITNHAGTDVLTSAQAIVVDDWYRAAVIYNASTHVISLYINEVFIDDAVIDLSATTYDSIVVLNAGSPDVSVAYCRAWSNILSVSELTSESLVTVAAKDTGLLWDCPLQAGIDLTSHNNTLNQLSAVGTITTDTDDPLISIIAGPPTNIDPNTATEISLDSVVFQNTLTAGAATTVWYKYTAVIGDKVLGSCGFGDLTTYKPVGTIYEGLANALSSSGYMGGLSSNNSPLQFPVTVGQTYYFKFTRNGAVTPATLKASILRGLNLTVPAGAIAVNDDTDGFPLVILDSSTGYPIKFILDFPASEGAASLNVSGNLLTADEGAPSSEGIKLFSSDYETVLANIALAGLSSTKIATNGTTHFLIGIAQVGPVHAKLRLASSAGVLDATVFDIGAFSGLWAVGLNAGVTIGYYISINFNTPVKRWDLVNNIALTDLVAGVSASYGAGKDILVMSDGSVVVPYTSDFNDKVIGYSSAGATQHTLDLVQVGFHNGQDNRVFSALDDPNSFWAWIRYETGVSRFLNIKYSDFSFLTDLNGIIQYENGQWQGGFTNTPVRFGHSESCPAWIVRVATPPVDVAKSGLYTVSGTGAQDDGTGTNPNPIIRHDQDWIDVSAGTFENVKIPDPYYDTFLAGDE